MKRLILLAAFAAGTVVAQSADISGAQLISGDADVRLQQLAREAATSNRKLIISAPEYWHEMILEQVRRGGGDRLQVEVRDSFAEAVMVRSDVLAGGETPAVAATAAPAASPAPATAAVVAAQAVAPPAPAARPTPPAPIPSAPVAARIASAPAAVPAPATTANPAQPAVAAAAPATRAPQLAPTPAPRPAAAAPATSAAAAASPPAAAAQGVATGTAPAQVSAIKRRLETSLNDGEPITRTLSMTQLEPKDLLFVRDGVVAVLRRISLRKDWFWLEGDIELRRIELRELGPDRYEVDERMRVTDEPRLRVVPSSERAVFPAAELEKHAIEREQLERRYNGGNRITATLLPTQLNQRDVIYVGDELSVVARVTGLLLERFWLVGRIDLARPELRKDGNNKYRVVENIRQ